MPASAAIGGTTNRKWRIPLNEGPWPTTWQVNGKTMTKAKMPISRNRVPAGVPRVRLSADTGTDSSAAAAPSHTRAAV